jgi:hypothetical protein
MYLRHALAVACTLIVVGTLPSVLRAAPPAAPPPVAFPHGQQQPPPYIVLKGDNVGQTYPVSAPAYAYGWFGVCPRGRHVNDGTGYYNNYHESSIRRGY